MILFPNNDHWNFWTFPQQPSTPRIEQSYCHCCCDMIHVPRHCSHPIPAPHGTVRTITNKNSHTPSPPLHGRVGIFLASDAACLSYGFHWPQWIALVRVTTPSWDKRMWPHTMAKEKSFFQRITREQRNGWSPLSLKTMQNVRDERQQKYENSHLSLTTAFLLGCGQKMRTFLVDLLMLASVRQRKLFISSDSHRTRGLGIGKRIRPVKVEENAGGQWMFCLAVIKLLFARLDLLFVELLKCML